MNKREYIQANKDWLEAKSKEEGVKALPKGIYYKVLSEGRSAGVVMGTGTWGMLARHFSESCWFVCVNNVA